MYNYLITSLCASVYIYHIHVLINCYSGPSAFVRETNGAGELAVGCDEDRGACMQYNIRGK